MSTVHCRMLVFVVLSQGGRGEGGEGEGRGGGNTGYSDLVLHCIDTARLYTLSEISTVQ